MIPHERSLVEKLKDQPFALVGVNSDKKENLQKAVESEKITWRSFFDGGNTSGPIATKWNVSGWPTIYILDKNGVIRARDLRGEEMEKKVEELLAERAAKGGAANQEAAPASEQSADEPAADDEPDSDAASSADDPQLLASIRAVERMAPSSESEKFLRDVVATSKNRAARGWATFTLSHLLSAVADDAALLAASKRDAAGVKKEAESLLQKVVDDYYFVDHRQRGYLGAVAEAELFELQHLQVGMVAPEIEGADEDGVPFKLSDYRGKVVALDFWGFWCPLCRRALPEERSMVAKLKDEPFALVGVNSDPKVRLVEEMKYEKLAWRSFFDGGDAYGPIAQRWNVLSWPTLYVLDANGVIRAKTEDHSLVERTVEELLASMKRSAKTPTSGG